MPNSPRSRILAATEDLIALRGYSAVGTRDIAERAGVNESTVFRLFGSKEKLARAAIMRATEPAHLPSMPRAILSSETLSGAANLYAAWYAQHVNSRVVRLLVVLAVETDIRIPIARSHLAMIERITRAQEAGEAMAGDPKSLLRTLHSALWGNAILTAVHHPIVDPGSSAYAEVSTIVRVWLRGVLR